MHRLLRKMLGKGKEQNAQDSAGLINTAKNSNKKTGRREPPKELDWSQAEYVPLPPSPSTWGIDGRDEFHQEYNDPSIGPVFQAGFKKQYTKVVKLSSYLSPKQRGGRVGEVIAKAYGKLIVQRMKSGQLAAAARQSVEMFERVPEYIKDTDLRRFNRILIEMEKSGKKHRYEAVEVATPSLIPLFEMSEGASWSLLGERKLKSEERPDPAFSIISIDAKGTWLLNRSGGSKGQPGVKSVLRRMDRHRGLIGEKSLLHEAYRIGTGAVGSGIAIMDSSGLLHVYDEELNIVVESNLCEDSRVADHFRTIDTNYWGDFKTQVRAVDVAPELDRYLFTLADEAWCCLASGDAVWGVAMPLKQGWKRVVGRSERYGVAQEVEEALRIFGLSLPVDPTEIKKKYRKLAQAQHPDRNLGDSSATEKMTALNNAFEILTGVDPNTLSYEESDITYFAQMDSDYFIKVEGLQLKITMTGEMPQDWVYAASFSDVDGRAYLATYSGKIIRVSREGQPEVVYDIGICPKDIIHIGRYTYFLTFTRLYVIEDSTKLAAFIDVFQQGQLLVTQAGFGLLTGKRFQWFSPVGLKIGELFARDPIRVIYATSSAVIVQTRQHQVTIQGLLM